VVVKFDRIHNCYLIQGFKTGVLKGVSPFTVNTIKKYNTDLYYIFSMISKLQEFISKTDSINPSTSSEARGVRGSPPTLFQLPISYIHDKYPIQTNIKIDLGIDENIEKPHIPSLYNHIFNPKSMYSNKVIPMWSQYYTTNIPFLNDTKKFIKSFKHIETHDSLEIEQNIANVTEILDEINEETGFCEKYKYIDIKFFEFLNKNSFVLQGLTIYNLTSPVISLVIPILMLIMPFFILKIQKIPISITTYINMLIYVFKNHVIGKAVSEFSKVGWDRRFFIIMSVVFYFINIYQNIISCHTFYKNIYKIRQYLLSINKFLSYSINSITNINLYCKSSYEGFSLMNEHIKSILCEFSNEISLIKLEKVSIRQISKIGEIMRSFYELFKNNIYREAIIYSLYLHGYIENITELQKNISCKNINYCTFTRRSCRFKEAYFAPLVNKEPIKNTYKLTKNILITGPNAAGKTTLLKTTLTNVILSQQIGCGFYKKAIINPYRYIHSYINIPDTSDRDSLFQAEARRCKEILDSVTNSDPLQRHFCIFDEIYSGTNPTEAIASACSFLKYISNFSNIDYMLTTHYISLCTMMNSVKNTSNYQMECLDYKSDSKENCKNTQNIISQGHPIYTYKLITGISNVKGGIKVLEELEYSEKIIDSARKIMDNIQF
jgi:hypothetical protein